VVKTFGGVPALKMAQGPSRRFVQQLAVGRDADPAVAELVYDLFVTTPRAGRGGCARMIVDAMGPGNDIDLSGLTVPTLVIGSTRDRLLPITQSRRIAEAVPNLVELAELSGGHCAILERPQEVNAKLRALIESARTAQAG
jgi:pimeloyl-ACP methyl ester carboxylesterase